MSAQPAAAHVIQACRGPQQPPRVIQCKISRADQTRIARELTPRIRTEGIHFDWTIRAPEYVLSEALRQANFRTLERLLRGYGLHVTEENLNELAGVLSEILARVTERSGFREDRAVSWLRPAAEPVVAARVEARVEPEHLEDFHRETDVVLRSHDPQTVRALVQVNGRGIAESRVADAELEGAIQVPDRADRQCSDSTRDGEVALLIAALKSFFAHMGSAPRDRDHYTLALSGPYGPCNGCKKRIAKLCELWQATAVARLPRGLRAKLTVTYRYAQAPQVQRDNYYGWEEDSIQRSPYHHTVTAEATGTRV